jgi:G3E family GTPase
MQLYLITGFLGAGKTTLIKKIVHAFSDKRIHLVINEFGREGIDGSLLKEIGAALAEINNGSIFCVCRLDLFENELVKAVEQKPDVILVEASGLADPTNIKKMMTREEYRDIDYRGSICLVDAPRFAKVVDTARVVRRQLSVSSLFIINKVDLATPEQIEFARSTILAVNPAAEIVETSYAEIDSQRLYDMQDREYDFEADIARDITLQKFLITISPDMQPQQLESFLNMIAEDTYRIKGFVCLEGQLMLVDCVGTYVDVGAYDGSAPEEVNKIVVLAGPGMPTRKSIKKAREWYPEQIIEVNQG